VKERNHVGFELMGAALVRRALEAQDTAAGRSTGATHRGIGELFMDDLPELLRWLRTGVVAALLLGSFCVFGWGLAIPHKAEGAVISFAPLIQFPLYGGIATIMTGAKGFGDHTVADQIAHAFVSLTTAGT
jgi:hypothetical protein